MTMMWMMFGATHSVLESTNTSDSSEWSWPFYIYFNIVNDHTSHTHTCDIFPSDKAKNRVPVCVVVDVVE